MFTTLPQSPQTLIDWRWPQIEPFINELASRSLNVDNVQHWIADWSQVSEKINELYSRLYIAITVDTSDTEAESRYLQFMDDIFPRALAAEQVFKQKLLDSGLEPESFAIPLRNFKAEADLFREENLPLLSEEQKLANEYNKISGKQTVEWEGRELTVAQIKPVLQETDRDRREAAWRASIDRQMADRADFNNLWQRFLKLRREIAANAGKSNYRAYKWQELLRFDYTPEDALRFDAAIEAVVVPAAQRIYDRRRKRLGLDSLRPWDLDVDPINRHPLRPFSNADDLVTKSSNIFHRVHPQLGSYFDSMVMEDLLDLDNRKNKAPGAYCIDLPSLRRPFIFSNSVGTHDDVQTLLHESGHAFHVFERASLPYYHQMLVPTEFAEVASMSMELLAFPYIVDETGGFYTPTDAARAEIEHLEGLILFWPYMAVVDSFQHWVYTHPDAASNPDKCDQQWATLWDRFMKGVDWSGLEEEKMTGWHRKLHIFQIPFYYIEYGLAQLGAVQVWANSLKNPVDAVQNYRYALSLGGTAALPDLFEAAGARLSFQATMLEQAVALIETTIANLELLYQ
jgi:oligoendopeptidase F